MLSAMQMPHVASAAMAGSTDGFVANRSRAVQREMVILLEEGRQRR